MTALKQTPGGLQSVFDNGLVCRFCFFKLKLGRKLADVGNAFPELLQQNKSPAANPPMQPAASIPQDHVKKDGIIRKPQGPVAKPPKK